MPSSQLSVYMDIEFGEHGWGRGYAGDQSAKPAGHGGWGSRGTGRRRLLLVRLRRGGGQAEGEELRPGPPQAHRRRLDSELRRAAQPAESTPTARARTDASPVRGL